MWTYLATLAAALAALAAVARRIHLWQAVRALLELGKWVREFLEDWRGDPGRPGEDPTPGFPARLEQIEKRAQNIEHFTRGDVAVRLELIGREVHSITQQSDRQHLVITGVAGNLDELERRVTEHRRRNDEQIRLLQKAVDRLDRRFTGFEEQASRRRATDFAQPTEGDADEEPA